MIEQKSLFELLGGRPCLEKVHKIFYDKIYSHPILSQFFKNVNQQHQENQQTDFMAHPLGGKAIYAGKFPVPAHAHLFITEEIFELRNQLLTESLREAGVPTELADRWIRIDSAFKNGLVKKSISECKQRYSDEDIIVAIDTQKKAG